jgi:hypothetical protein
MPFDTDNVPVAILPTGVYRLTSTLLYKGNPEHGGDEIIVPTGFTTDLASVPRFLSWLTPIAGIHDRAVIVHDINCVRLADAYRLGGRAQINAVDTDGLLLRQLRELGMREYLARAYWVGVRYGALGNPARRPGWWSTLGPVLLWTLLLLPVIPAALLTGLTLGGGHLVGWVVDAVRGRTSAVRRRRRVFAVRRNPARTGA